MGSQTDLDQGGSTREWVKKFLGPSIGWVWVPSDNILLVTTGGTTTVLLGTTLVLVNVPIPGVPTIKLPSAIHPLTPAIGQPISFIDLPITIVDVGGNASPTNPIGIVPASGAENIFGLTSIDITSQYGAVTLRPSNAIKGWSMG